MVHSDPIALPEGEAIIVNNAQIQTDSDEELDELTPSDDFREQVKMIEDMLPALEAYQEEFLKNLTKDKEILEQMRSQNDEWAEVVHKKLSDIESDLKHTMEHNITLRNLLINIDPNDQRLEEQVELAKKFLNSGFLFCQHIKHWHFLEDVYKEEQALTADDASLIPSTEGSA